MGLDAISCSHVAQVSSPLKVSWVANKRFVISKFNLKFLRSRNLEIIGLVLGCIEASKKAMEARRKWKDRTKREGKLWQRTTTETTTKLKLSRQHSFAPISSLSFFVRIAELFAGSFSSSFLHACFLTTSIVCYRSNSPLQNLYSSLVDDIFHSSLVGDTSE